MLNMAAVSVASVGCDVAMKLDQSITSRTFEKIIGVLGDLDDVWSAGQCEMTGVRLRVSHLYSSSGVPFHDQLGIFGEPIG